MSAIERIQGFACEVTQEQWEELVRVADSVGVKVGSISRIDGIYSNKYPYAAITNRKNNLCTFPTREGNTLIPYPDFLCKLKGEEKWEPKNGEEVEVRPDSNYVWGKAIFIGMDVDGKHVVRVNRIGQTPYVDVPPHNIRKPIETITRQEAEAILNKRIID
jgi:hypothetical protein